MPKFMAYALVIAAFIVLASDRNESTRRLRVKYSGIGGRLRDNQNIVIILSNPIKIESRNLKLPNSVGWL
jgi:hypothetical protein